MDQISKILVISIVLVSFFSISATAFKYFVLQDYVVRATTKCDPLMESCFMSVCDPVEEECSSEIEDKIEYYKIIEKSAHQFPLCSSEDCAEMTCEASEGDCTEIFCDENLAEEIGDDCEVVEPSTADGEDIMPVTGDGTESDSPLDVGE